MRSTGSPSLSAVLQQPFTCKAKGLIPGTRVPHHCQNLRSPRKRLRLLAASLPFASPSAGLASDERAQKDPQPLASCGAVAEDFTSDVAQGLSQLRPMHDFCTPTTLAKLFWRLPRTGVNMQRSGARVWHAASI